MNLCSLCLTVAGIWHFQVQSSQDAGITMEIVIQHIKKGMTITTRGILGFDRNSLQKAAHQEALLRMTIIPSEWAEKMASTSN